MNGSANPDFLQDVRDAVFKKSLLIKEDSLEVKGYDFNNGIDYEALLDTFLTTGFQATNFGKAIKILNQMIESRSSQLSDSDGLSTENYIYENYKDYHGHCDCPKNEPNKRAQKCTIFLAYTSNLISSGLRETIRFLVQHNLVDVLVTSAGGVEEDLIKCLAPTYLGAFDLPGASLRARGLNRIGNLLVPNENYCKFEDWIMPIFDEMLSLQKLNEINWTPSRMISHLGHKINNPESIYYWAHKNSIPVFCPALTDGSLGDMLYFHSYRNPGLKLDIIEDVRRINNAAVHCSPETGVLILGGGLVKHHTLNANMMRNGADYGVYINTSQEFDGSDAGAAPTEAVSWGKIKTTAEPVKLFADATIVFPLLVARTFAKQIHPRSLLTKHNGKSCDELHN